MITPWSFLNHIIVVDQRRRQNLKEPQNFTEVLNIDDVTVNDFIQRNQHRKEK